MFIGGLKFSGFTTCWVCFIFYLIFNCPPWSLLASLPTSTFCLIISFVKHLSSTAFCCIHYFSIPSVLTWKSMSKPVRSLNPEPWARSPFPGGWEGGWLGSVWHGECTIYSWRGADFRKEEDRAGTTDDKSLHSPLARVLCVHWNMGVCDFQGFHFYPNNNAWFQGSWTAARFSHLDPYSV